VVYGGRRKGRSGTKKVDSGETTIKGKGAQGTAGRRGLKVTGTVVTGLGESGSFLAIPWVKNQLKKALGFSPYCGTLNIDVHDPKIQKALKRSCEKRILPEEEGFCDALVCGGTIAGRLSCGVILPLVPHYSDTILELVAPVHLKEALSIDDGDEIEVELFP
jgi:riboflavin kinase